MTDNNFESFSLDGKMNLETMHKGIIIVLTYAIDILKFADEDTAATVQADIGHASPYSYPDMLSLSSGDPSPTWDVFQSYMAQNTQSSSGPVDYRYPNVIPDLNGMASDTLQQWNTAQNYVSSAQYSGGQVGGEFTPPMCEQQFSLTEGPWSSTASQQGSGTASYNMEQQSPAKGDFGICPNVNPLQYQGHLSSAGMLDPLPDHSTLLMRSGPDHYGFIGQHFPETGIATFSESTCQITNYRFDMLVNILTDPGSETSNFQPMSTPHLLMPPANGQLPLGLQSSFAGGVATSGLIVPERGAFTTGLTSQMKTPPPSTFPEIFVTQQEPWTTNSTLDVSQKLNGLQQSGSSNQLSVRLLFLSTT